MTGEYVALPLGADLERTGGPLVAEPGIDGLEVSMAEIVPANEQLPHGADATALADRLREAGVRRIHCTYWGSPTNFFSKVNFRQLADRFGSLDAVRTYYGDLTGRHMMRRWVDEYALARSIGARSYVFHLIDYATVDGAWEFTIPKSTIRQAMASILQQLIVTLDEEALLEDSSPLIEIENAGWGLEHGMQTAADAAATLNEIVDLYDRVRVGWDINHLLHAIGIDASTGRACFQLPDNEIDDSMRALAQDLGNDPTTFAHAWIEQNVEAAVLHGRNGAVHLSDRKLPEVEYFRNGILNPPLHDELRELTTAADQEEYGYQVVLKYFDTHVPVGHGALDPRKLALMIERLTRVHPDLDVLHELKTSQDPLGDLREQRAALSAREVSGAGRADPADE